MFDVRVDDSLDIIFGASGDVSTVSEVELDRQRLRVLIVAQYDQFIGETGTANLARKLELAAERIANTLEFVETVSNVTVAESEDDANTIVVSVLFDTGEEFVFDI